MSLDATVEVVRGSLRLTARLAVADGEVVAVLGPNGAGKSSLLQALAGLVPLSAGRILIGDQVVADTDQGIAVPAHVRGLGVVFAEPLLFPHLSARDNVAFGLRAAGTGRSAARREASTWLARLGVGDHDDARPGALSSGQAQRVALARALAPRPRALLLDEPLSAVDLAGRQLLRTDLRRHLLDFRGPCVLVTHDPIEAMLLASRLVILEGGTITQDGSVEEVTHRPRSEWAARLVGLNLLRGTADGTAVTLLGGHVVTTAAHHRGDVHLVVRPGAIALYRRRPEGSPRNVVPATVASVDAHGERIRVHLDGPVPLVAEVTPAALGALDLGAGGAVWAVIKATEVIVHPA